MMDLQEELALGLSLWEEEYAVLLLLEWVFFEEADCGSLALAVGMG